MGDADVPVEIVTKLDLEKVRPLRGRQVRLNYTILNRLRRCAPYLGLTMFDLSEVVSLPGLTVFDLSEIVSLPVANRVRPLRGRVLTDG